LLAGISVGSLLLYRRIKRKEQQQHASEAGSSENNVAKKTIICIQWDLTKPNPLLLPKVAPTRHQWM
jgi:hypothetical protein